MGRAGSALRLIGSSAALIGLTAMVASQPASASRLHGLTRLSAATGPVAYVTNGTTISVLNASSGRAKEPIRVQIPSTYSLEDLALSPTGQNAYVVANTNTLLVVDLHDGAIIKSQGLSDNAANDPVGIALSQSANEVYIACQYSNKVDVLNTTTNTVLNHPISVGSRPYGVAFSPTGQLAYVANQGSDSVSVIDADTNSVSSTIEMPTGQYPVDVAVSPSGLFLYVISASARPADGTFNVVDAQTGIVLKTLTIPSPVSLAITPTGDEAFVANSLRTLSVIDLTTDSVKTTIHNLVQTQVVAINPSGTLAYVLQGGGLAANVAVISTSSYKVVRVVPLSGPSAIAFS